MANQWAVLSTFGVALLLYVLLIMADTVVALSGKAELRRLVERGNRMAGILRNAHESRQRWTTAALLLRVLLLLIAGSAGAYLATHLALGTGWRVLLTLALWLLIVTCHLAARLVAQTNAAALALRLAPLIMLFSVIMVPFAMPLRWFTTRLRDNIENEEDSILIANDGTRLLLPSDSEEDDIEESEKEMITSILEMDGTVVREVMVPRIDIVAIEDSATIEDALGVIIGAGHSRIPVYEESVDQVIGILYAKDLLKYFHREINGDPIRALARPAYFVPLSKDIMTLLSEMRKHRVHIAVVVDEYGGTAGLVTIEDILEEIVGEIQDEYDAAEEVLVQRIGEESYIISARLDVYSLAKLLDIDIEGADADTAGGLVFGSLGHVAEPGESIEHQGWRFTVLEVDGRRIGRVRVDPLKPHPRDTEEPDGATAKPLANPMKFSATKE